MKRNMTDVIVVASVFVIVASLAVRGDERNFGLWSSSQNLFIKARARFFLERRSEPKVQGASGPLAPF
jgi:hypothetical protein